VFILKEVRGELGRDGRAGDERGGDGRIVRDWARAARRWAKNNIDYYNIDVNSDCGIVRTAGLERQRLKEKNPRPPKPRTGHPKPTLDFTCGPPARQ